MYMLLLGRASCNYVYMLLLGRASCNYVVAAGVGGGGG